MTEPILTLTQEAFDEVWKEGGSIDRQMHLYLRVGVKGGGCSGFNYDLDLVHGRPRDTDIVWEQLDPCAPEGAFPAAIRIAVDPVSAQYLRGCVIHWGKAGLQSGFRFENPMAKSTCGCGKSFVA
jgi:iron-sulfur cluster assembly protein